MASEPVIKLPNIGRDIVQSITPDSWDPYTDVLTEAPGDFGGAFRDLSKLGAAKPGDPPALPEVPTAENSQKALQEASAGQRRARGRASTILNNGTGSSNSVTSSRRTLLGS